VTGNVHSGEDMRRGGPQVPINLYEPSTINRWRGGGTRIFSPLAVAGLCDTIGRYVYLSKRLTTVPAGRFYRLVHIVTYSSGKVIAK